MLKSSIEDVVTKKQVQVDVVEDANAGLEKARRRSGPKSLGAIQPTSSLLDKTTHIGVLSLVLVSTIVSIFLWLAYEFSSRTAS